MNKRSLRYEDDSIDHDSKDSKGSGIGLKLKSNLVVVKAENENTASHRKHVCFDEGQLAISEEEEEEENKEVNDHDLKRESDKASSDLPGIVIEQLKSSSDLTATFIGSPETST